MRTVHLVSFLCAVSLWSIVFLQRPAVVGAQGTCTKTTPGSSACLQLWRRVFRGEEVSDVADFNSDNAVSLGDFELWRRSFPRPFPFQLTPTPSPVADTGTPTPSPAESTVTPASILSPTVSASPVPGISATVVPSGSTYPSSEADLHTSQRATVICREGKLSLVWVTPEREQSARVTCRRFPVASEEASPTRPPTPPVFTLWPNEEITISCTDGRLQATWVTSSRSRLDLQCAAAAEESSTPRQDSE